MKKVLLGTSAIALAGAFTSQASAAEWEVRVGGYMEQYVAYADVDAKGGTGVFTGDEEFDGVDSKQDNEIHFLPKITLDNGIEIGADVQLEGTTQGDQIDEAFLRIKGSFGEVNLGSENSAGYKMTYAAPDVTFVNVNSGSLTAFVPFSGSGVGADFFRGTLGTSFVEVGRNNDAQRITYYTPRFAGFQAGVSYARDGNQDSNGQLDTDSPFVSSGNALAGINDIVDIGANYVNSFGGFDVAISGRYGFSDRSDSAAGTSRGNPEVWAAGANLGFGGFTIGGSYADADADHDQQEGEYWDAGVSYVTGPWAFSFTYARGENKNNEDFGCALCGNGDEEVQQYLVGANYALAQGVRLGVFGAYVDFEEDFEAAFGSPGEDVEGWVLGTEMKITF